MDGDHSNKSSRAEPSSTHATNFARTLTQHDSRSGDVMPLRGAMWRHLEVGTVAKLQ